MLQWHTNYGFGDNWGGGHFPPGSGLTQRARVQLPWVPDSPKKENFLSWESLVPRVGYNRVKAGDFTCRRGGKSCIKRIQRASQKILQNKGAPKQAKTMIFNPRVPLSSLFNHCEFFKTQLNSGWQQFAFICNSSPEISTRVEKASLTHPRPKFSHVNDFTNNKGRDELNPG